MLRGGRAPALALLLTVSALALAGCGSGAGLSLARQACGHVDRSLAIYAQAARTPDAGRSAALQSAALGQLRQALPLAAQATSDDGTWAGLMTTISESSRVEEGNLVPALRLQCAQADSNNPNGVPGPVPTGGGGSGGAGGGGTTPHPTIPGSLTTTTTK